MFQCGSLFTVLKSYIIYLILSYDSLFKVNGIKQVIISQRRASSSLFFGICVFQNILLAFIYKSVIVSGCNLWVLTPNKQTTGNFLS